MIPRIHGWCTSPFCHKVLMAFASSGTEYTWVPAPLMRRGRLTRASGSSLVPVVEVDGTFIPDSTAILHWLDEHVGGGIYPEDPIARAQCILFEDIADETLTVHVHAAVWGAPGNPQRLLAPTLDDAPNLDTRIGTAILARVLPRVFRRMATARRDEAGSRALLSQQLDAFDAMLRERPYLLGDLPTAADFAVAGQLLNVHDLRPDLLEARAGLRRVVSGLARGLGPRFRARPLPAPHKAALAPRTEL